MMRDDLDLPTPDISFSLSMHNLEAECSKTRKVINGKLYAKSPDSKTFHQLFTDSYTLELRTKATFHSQRVTLGILFITVYSKM